MSSSKTWPQTVFKAYDIRGTLPDQLNPEFAKALGMALATEARNQNVNTIVVGYDGRKSSPSLSEALQAGIRLGGVNTIDLGMVPTPVVYFATHELNTGSGVAITGSHNPPNYNGFKIMLAGKTLYGPSIANLHSLMEQASNPNASSASKHANKQQGNTSKIGILQTYVNRISSDVKLERPMKIAIDCGNGVGGVVAEKLFKAIGCEVDTLYCDVDGAFPNHHPDPAVPANLVDLIDHVQNSDCELGLAFDGDADRLGVVTRSGEIIWPDRQLILFAQDVLKRKPESTILFDVKCSRHVQRAIEQAGGKALMWQTGHSLIKAKMAEIGSPLGGEMSGHVFFDERWYGFDDGLYAGARLLEILSRHSNPSEVLHQLPKDVSTPELKIEMQEGEPYDLIQRLQQQGKFPSSIQINTIDGVRAEYEDGFGLARASNTTPVVVLRFEGETTQALQRIQEEFRKALSKLAPNANLPF